MVGESTKILMPAPLYALWLLGTAASVAVTVAGTYMMFKLGNDPMIGLIFGPLGAFVAVAGLLSVSMFSILPGHYRRMVVKLRGGAGPSAPSSGGAGRTGTRWFHRILDLMLDLVGALAQAP